MIKAILTDIEGTISSLEYVRKVMFPYSKKNLRSFMTEHKEEDIVKKTIRELSDKLGKSVDIEESIKILESWIDADLKEPILKEIQGYIWEEGFKDGKLKGHIYQDAYIKLMEWKEIGIKIYVFSSGSVKAQKLFFKYTDYGDITNIFSGFFDTKMGSKKDKDSYLKISDEIKLKPREILFLSDIEEELDASREAGMKTIRVLRDGIEISSKHKVVRDFSSISLNSFID